MQITKRRGAAIAAGLLLATTCFAAQPALAAAGRAGSVTSKQIKDNTILLKDLNAAVRAKIALGTTALQSIADGVDHHDQLADNAVTNPKIADDAGRRGRDRSPPST